MNYKAKNVDTDKALEHIEWSRKYQDEATLGACESSEIL